MASLCPPGSSILQWVCLSLPMWQLDCPWFQRREQQCFRPQGAGLRTGPASLPPPSSDQSQPQLQPRFKGQENLHFLMAGAVESRDKRGGFSGRGITVIIWWSSSDSLGGCSMKTKTHYNLHVWTRMSVQSLKMTGGTIKRRCHLGQMGTNFPGKCWKSIIQSLIFLFSGLKSPQAVCHFTAVCAIFFFFDMLIVWIYNAVFFPMYSWLEAWLVFQDWLFLLLTRERSPLSDDCR